MKKAIRALIQSAKELSESSQSQEYKHPSRLAVASTSVPSTLIDEMLEPQDWYSFPQLAKRFSMSHDKISKDFIGRTGVIKPGSDYRVPEFAVRQWLAESALNARRAA